MKFKLIVYFISTLFLTLALGLGQEQLNINYKIIAFPQMAPAIAFLVMILFFKSLRISLNIKFDDFFYNLLALVMPFGLIALGFFMFLLFNFKFEYTADFLISIPAVIGGMLFGSVGEEIGWRGFLQPTVEKQYSKLVSTIIVGVLWGLWHIGNYQHGLFFMIGFLVFTISASIILRELLDNTANNLFVSVFFHLSINLVFFKNSLTNDKMICLNAIVWALIALVVLFIANKKQKLQLVPAKKELNG